MIARASQRSQEWQKTVLDSWLDQSVASTREALLNLVPATVAEFAKTADDFVPAADNAVRDELRRRADAAVRGFSEQVNAFARTIADEAAAVVAPLLSQPIHIAASVLGIEPRDGALDEDETARLWSPPQIDAAAAVGGVLAPRPIQPPHTPLPKIIATRTAARALSRRVDDYVDLTYNNIRERIVEFLNDLVAELDRVSQQRLIEERRRVDAAVTPAGSAPAVSDALRRLDSLLAQATTLRAALLRGDVEQAVAAASPEPSNPMPTPRPAAAADQPADGTPPPRVDDSVTGTCPVCAAASRAMFDFLCHFQYAVSHESATQRQFIAAHGLCPTHTWHLERVSSPRGLSLGYPPLLDTVEKRVQALADLEPAAVAARLRELDATSDTCSVCRTRQMAEQATAQRIARNLATDAGRTQFERSQWLCLPHLRLVLTGLDNQTSATLLRIQSRRIAEMSDSMREYVIKHDARRRSLMTDEEVRAYRQALVLLVGERFLAAIRTDE